MYDAQNVLSVTVTKQDVITLLDGIDVVKELQYHTKPEDTQVALGKRLGMDVASILTSYLEQNKVTIHSPELSKCLDFLKQILESLPVIEVTLAIDPTQQMIDEITHWIRENGIKDAVISVLVNASVLGGMILVYEGKYKDLSLKKAFAEYFATHKESILKTV